METSRSGRWPEIGIEKPARTLQKNIGGGNNTGVLIETLLVRPIMDITWVDVSVSKKAFIMFFF
jgi:hypothetical protein